MGKQGRLGQFPCRFTSLPFRCHTKKCHTCWLCETLLTDDSRSQEHIVPEKLGGKRTVSGFLCRRCNNSTGSKWDAPLIETIKPMDFIASLRDWHESEPPLSCDLSKRANRHDSVSGKETRTMYRGGGNSVVFMDGRELQVGIASHSEAQMSGILRGILRKFSIPHDEWADIEKQASSLLTEATAETHMIQAGIPVNLPAASRAMVKCMLALACAEGMNRKDFQGILAHLSMDNHRYIGDLPDWEVLPQKERVARRCVAISGSAETQVLFGFVDFGGFLPWMIPLIAPYEGPPCHAVYAIDVKTGNEVNVSPNMEQPRAEAVAMETAACLAKKASSVEDLSPEEVASLAALGYLPSEGELRSIGAAFYSRNPRCL